MLKFIGVTCCLLLLSCGLSGCSDDAPTRPMVPPPTHILLIGIDTMRGDHLEGGDLDWIRTPALKALAADGVSFWRARATAPWTLPSFASIFTGLRPYHHGTIGGIYAQLPKQKICLAEYLNDGGYLAAGLVSIDYLTHHFDMVRGYNAPLPDFGDMDCDRATRATRAAKIFFSHYREKPFYLFVHYFDPHTPYEPPAPFDRMYYEGDEKAPGVEILDFLRSDRNLAKNRDGAMYDFLAGVTDPAFPARQHAACVTYTDSQIGDLMAGLKQLGLYEMMLIIVVADHGEHLGEHDLWYTHALPYEETLHVPLLFKLPRNHFAGTVVERPVSTLDILPTVLDLARLPIPPTLDGNSLLEVMAGRPRERETLLTAEQGSSPDEFCKVIYDWPWKLMLRREGTEDRWELYHLLDDPLELDNRASAEETVMERLREVLWTEFDPGRPLVAGDEAIPAELDEATRQRLRSLGY